MGHALAAARRRIRGSLERRIDGRQRGIPGWYELTWQEVLDVRARYEPWRGAQLVLDGVRPLEENLAALERYLAGV